MIGAYCTQDLISTANPMPRKGAVSELVERKSSCRFFPVLVFDDDTKFIRNQTSAIWHQTLNIKFMLQCIPSPCIHSTTMRCGMRRRDRKLFLISVFCLFSVQDVRLSWEGGQISTPPRLDSTPYNPCQPDPLDAFQFHH